MTDTRLLEEVQDYVTKLLSQKTPDYLCYHNIAHTLNVVEGAMLIAEKEGLPEYEKIILLISAWFHDTGYILKYEDHESESKKIAYDFLTFRGVAEDYIAQILDNIDATRYPQNPGNKTAKILCDADMYHLSQHDFLYKSNLFRNEKLHIFHLQDEEETYLNNTLEFLKHKYHTSYGRKVLAKGKESNIRLLKQLIDQTKR
jgi:uncharacterized protein